MGVTLAAVDTNDDDNDGDAREETAGSGRWGLAWDPEEGPVWGKVGGAEGEQKDTWTQLLNEGVNGITTDSDGEVSNRHIFP